MCLAAIQLYKQLVNCLLRGYSLTFTGAALMPTWYSVSNVMEILDNMVVINTMTVVILAAVVARITTILTNTSGTLLTVYQRRHQG